jgi:hypothetical protein
MLLTLVFSLLLVVQGTPKIKVTQGGGVEQLLNQMEDDWQKATRTKDTAALKRIIAEDWVATDDRGRLLDREQYLSQTTSNPDVVQSNENTDMKVLSTATRQS